MKFINLHYVTVFSNGSLNFKDSSFVSSSQFIFLSKDHLNFAFNKNRKVLIKSNSLPIYKNKHLK